MVDLAECWSLLVAVLGAKAQLLGKAVMDDAALRQAVSKGHLKERKQLL
jgi:hypothetical protein